MKDDKWNSVKGIKTFANVLGSENDELAQYSTKEVNINKDGRLATLKRSEIVAISNAEVV